MGPNYCQPEQYQYGVGTISPTPKEVSHEHKEWDICPFIETPDDSQSAHNPPPVGDAPHGHVNFAEDLKYAFDTTKTALSERLDTPRLKRLLEHCYGFTVPENYVANPPYAQYFTVPLLFLQESCHSCGILVEFQWNAQECTGMHRIPLEFHRIPQEFHRNSTGIQLESSRIR